MSELRIDGTGAERIRAVYAGQTRAGQTRAGRRPFSVRAAALLAAGCLAAACGSSGGGDGNGNGNGNGNTDPPSSPGDTVTVSGVVTFDFVPSRPQEGLVYSATEARPVRAATVEAVADAGGAVLATATTDTAGQYALDVSAGETVFVRVRAEMIRTGPSGWDVRVLDNTSDDAPYVLDGAPFDTGEADSTRDLHAPSGWTGAGYGDARAAAPFAILDTVYDSMQAVLDVDPGLEFPALEVHWSPDNVPTASDLPLEERIASGEIGSSRYSGSLGIFLLGAEGSDTDEYDRHVVAHEWGHYFEHRFSRSDSIGGRHGFGDVLDMRTAFGEAFANVFSGIATGSPLYVDAVGPDQGQGFGFDLDGVHSAAPSDPGWFNEYSVHELLWDLYDDQVDGADATLALGFAPLYAVMTGAQVVTPALTSVFSFLEALKLARPGDAAAIDALTSANAIEPVEDNWGAGEDNDANTTEDNVLPVYRELAVNGGPVNVCSTAEFGAENKLGSRRFVRFSVGSLASHTITVTTTEKDPMEFADPDFAVHRMGVLARSEGEPSAVCKDTLAAEECFETTSLTLSPGEHVLDVYEWTNTNAPDDDEFPPIGRTCFDVKVTTP